MKHLTQAELERLYRNMPQVARDGVGLAAFCRLYRLLEDVDQVPEGCTPADAQVLREANHKLAQELHEVKAERDEARQSCTAAQRAAQPVAPIDMVLHCPACGMQHIDAPEPQRMTEPLPYAGTMMRMWAPKWDNPPHRSHLCHGCGHIWRPADVPTNGVAAVKTQGKADSPTARPMAVQPVAWRVRRRDAPDYWIMFMHRPVDALADPEREVQPLYTAAPAPVGLVPLTPERAMQGAIDNKCAIHSGEFPDVAFIKGVRFAEAEHGIKAGKDVTAC